MTSVFTFCSELLLSYFTFNMPFSEETTINPSAFEFTTTFCLSDFLMKNFIPELALISEKWETKNSRLSIGFEE